MHLLSACSGRKKKKEEDEEREKNDAPGTDTDLSGGRLPDTSLDDVAHVKLLDLLRLDTGPVDGVLDGDDTELRGGEGGEGAVLCADGGSGGGDDVHGVGLCVCVSA